MKYNRVFMMAAVLITIILLTAGCSDSKKSGKANKLENELNEAKKKLILGDNFNATHQLRAVIKEDPKNLEANYYLGVSYARIKKYDEAAKIFTTINDIDPEYPLGEEYSVLLIRTMIKENNLEKAEIIINKFVKMYPENKRNVKYLTWIADAYRNRAIFDKAVMHYNKIIEMYSGVKEYEYVIDTSEQMVKFIEAFSDHDEEPLKMFAEAKSKHMPYAALDIFRQILIKYPKSNIVPLVKLEIALSFDHGRMNLFDSALIYYRQLEVEFPDTDYADIGKKNRERIEAIFSQKVLSDTHLEEYKKNAEKSEH